MHVILFNMHYKLLLIGDGIQNNVVKCRHLWVLFDICVKERNIIMKILILILILIYRYMKDVSVFVDVLLVVYLHDCCKVLHLNNMFLKVFKIYWCTVVQNSRGWIFGIFARYEFTLIICFYCLLIYLNIIYLYLLF